MRRKLTLLLWCLCALHIAANVEAWIRQYRARGRNPRMPGVRKKPTKESLVNLVRTLLRGADGVRVVASGTLSRANGHRRGTPWVEIESDSILDCDVAEYRLSRLETLSPAPWENGWSLAENRQRDPSFRLTLYSRTHHRLLRGVAKAARRSPS